MDAVDHIVKITATVMRRLADGIDGGVPEPKPREVHIENLYVANPDEALAEIKERLRIQGEQMMKRPEARTRFGRR